MLTASRSRVKSSIAPDVLLDYLVWRVCGQIALNRDLAGWLSVPLAAGFFAWLSKIRKPVIGRAGNIAFWVLFVLLLCSLNLWMLADGSSLANLDRPETPALTS